MQCATVVPLEPLERPALVCLATGADGQVAVMMTARHTVMQTGVLNAFPARSRSKVIFPG